MESNLLFMGADVSKGYSDFLILNSKNKPVEDSYQLDDNAQGHEVLTEKLKELTAKGYSVICGVENTGGYERNWVKCLKNLSKRHKNIEIYKLNPKAVKHQIQSLLRRTITDGVSAEGIAMYMNNNYAVFKENWDKSTRQSNDLTEDKMLYGMIQSLLKQQTMKKNQLEKIVYQVFPELLVYTKNSTPQWVYTLLEKYPSASAVKRAKIKGLTAIRNITEQKAIVLKEQAIKSVSTPAGAIVELMVRQHCKDISTLNMEIKSLKKVLVQSYQSKEVSKEDLEILNSVSGISDWSAVGFLIEIGDYSRFETTSQLAAFFGVNPSYKQSGDGKYANKMSKQGSPRMRALLFIIANNLKNHDEYFRALYAKYIATGKKHRSVMGILMHKALRVLFGMLKTRTKYDSGIDRKNQERNTSDTEVAIAEISIRARRHQELSFDAPISRSNSNKRKAMLEPQASMEDEITRSSEHSLQQT